MKVLLLEPLPVRGHLIPKGAIAHLSDRRAVPLVKAGKARQVHDDARARVVPYEKDLCTQVQKK